MTPAKIYPFSIPAGGSFPLLVIGDYCKILTSSGPLTLNGDSFGSLGPILAGQGVEQTEFRRLVLTDNSGTVNNGTILIADNKFIDDRITGEVSVIDGQKQKTKTNSSYTTSVLVAASSSLISLAQLKNKSQNNVFIEKINFSVVAASAVGIGFYQYDLGGFIQFPVSKKAGGTDSSCEVRTISTTPFTPEKRILTQELGALGNSVIEFKTPLMLPPGFGIVCWTGSVDIDLRFGCEYVEESIL